MKTCFKCNNIKPLTEFYKHNAMADGFLNKCKDCAKKDANKHRANNIERIREYDRKRAKNPERTKLSVELHKIWRNEDKRRIKCHNTVSRAVKNGTLVKQPCIKCGNDKSQAHHHDYDKPLDVTWLCQICHSKLHQEMKGKAI